MERVCFEYDVLTHLRLSEEEVGVLSKLCEAHGDATVKALSVPGTGAVLNAARNSLESGFVTVRVTHRQLDTLCKATEWFLADAVGTMSLHMKLRTLLTESGAEWKRLNAK